MFKILNLKFKNILSIDSLEIPSEKVISIIGKSGSGKSTLLKLLNRMITPDSGDVYYNGQNLSELSVLEHRRKVVMLSQTPVIYECSIRDNLNMGLVFSNKPPLEDRELLQYLELMGISKALDESPSTMSGGEKQRLAICRALAMKPEVLLLDEPSAALDSESEQSVLSEVIALSKRDGFSVVMVTHSEAVYKRFSDIIVEVSNGSILNVEVVR